MNKKSNGKSRTILLALCWLAAAVARAGDDSSPPAAPSKFNPHWRQLLGEWTGESSGEPGSGTATSKFEFDLRDNVLIRRDHNEFAAANGQPATSHDGMMIVYPNPQGGAARAIYFDSEGHVIEYTASWSAAGDVLTFMSKPTPGMPQFRFIYTKIDRRTFHGSFDIAPPNQPGAFKTHVAGKMTLADK